MRVYKFIEQKLISIQTNREYPQGTHKVENGPRSINRGQTTRSLPQEKLIKR